MLIKLKNKDTLIIDDFKLKCCIGKKGIKIKKEEGDLSTPKGTFKLGSVYYRADRVSKPNTKLKCIKISKKMGWCNDIKSKNYNKEIKINSKFTHEKIFRRDNKYDYLILVKYNYANTIKGKGSAIFIHLTNSYKKTAGCIAISKKDFLIVAKLLNKNSRIIIN